MTTLGQEIARFLPHRYPFLLVDRVVEFEADKRIVAIKNVTWNEPYFTGHFPDRPVMPGVLICEAMAQAGGAAGARLVPRRLRARAARGGARLPGLDEPRQRQVPPPGDPGRSAAARGRAQAAAPPAVEDARRRDAWTDRSSRRRSSPPSRSPRTARTSGPTTGRWRRCRSTRRRSSRAARSSTPASRSVRTASSARTCGSARHLRWARTRPSAAHTTLGADNRIFPFASVGSAPQDKKYHGEDSRLVIGDRNHIREFASAQPRHRGRRHGDGGRQRQPVHEQQPRRTRLPDRQPRRARERRRRSPGTC